MSPEQAICADFKRQFDKAAAVIAEGFGRANLELLSRLADPTKPSFDDARKAHQEMTKLITRSIREERATVSTPLLPYAHLLGDGRSRLLGRIMTDSLTEVVLNGLAVGKGEGRRSSYEGLLTYFRGMTTFIADTNMFDKTRRSRLKRAAARAGNRALRDLTHEK